jgi:hypothetical protein
MKSSGARLRKESRLKASRRRFRWMWLAVLNAVACGLPLNKNTYDHHYLCDRSVPKFNDSWGSSFSASGLSSLKSKLGWMSWLS